MHGLTWHTASNLAGRLGDLGCLLGCRGDNVLEDTVSSADLDGLAVLAVAKNGIAHIRLKAKLPENHPCTTTWHSLLFPHIAMDHPRNLGVLPRVSR